MWKAWMRGAVAVALCTPIPTAVSGTASAQQLGEEFQVTTFTTGEQARPAVAVALDGSTLVARHSFGQDGSGLGIYGQRYDGSGRPLGGEFLVNSHLASDQAWPAVAVDGWGTFVVAWQSLNQDGQFYGVFGRRVLGPRIFSDGFETGDTDSWSVVAP